MWARVTLWPIQFVIHRLSPGKSQFFEQNLKCDWPNWCARVGKKLLISPEFLSQTCQWPAAPPAEYADHPREAVSACPWASPGNGYGAAAANSPLGSPQTVPQSPLSRTSNYRPSLITVPVLAAPSEETALWGTITVFWTKDRFFWEMTWQNVRKKRKDSKKFKNSKQKIINQLYVNLYNLNLWIFFLLENKHFCAAKRNEMWVLLSHYCDLRQRRAKAVISAPHQTSLEFDTHCICPLQS